MSDDLMGLYLPHWTVSSAGLSCSWAGPNAWCVLGVNDIVVKWMDALEWQLFWVDYQCSTWNLSILKWYRGGESPIHRALPWVDKLVLPWKCCPGLWNQFYSWRIYLIWPINNPSHQPPWLNRKSLRRDQHWGGTSSSPTSRTWNSPGGF